MTKTRKGRKSRGTQGIEKNKVKNEPLSDDDSYETQTGVSTTNKSSKQLGRNRREFKNPRRMQKHIEKLQRLHPEMLPWIPGGGQRIRRIKAAGALFSSSSGTQALT